MTCRFFSYLFFSIVLTGTLSAQNFELPSIFISGVEKQSIPEEYEKSIASPEKENAVEAEQLDEATYNAGIEIATGNRGRNRLSADYRLSLQDLYLSLDAGAEEKSASKRHDNYTYRTLAASLHFQINTTYSLLAEYEQRRDELELPGPQDIFTTEERLDDHSALLLGLERSDGNHLSKLTLYANRDSFNESFATTTLFRKNTATLLHQWEGGSVDATFDNERIQSEPVESSAAIRGSLNAIQDNWGYEVFLGIWDSNHYSAQPIGSANIEYFATEETIIRLNLESSHTRHLNENVYSRDNGTSIQEELLPINHLQKVEIAWAWTRLKELQWTLGVFGSSQNNYLYYDYEQSTGLYNPETMGDVNLAGVHFDFNLNIFNPVTIDMRYTYEHELDLPDDVRELPLHPHHAYNLDVAYTTPGFKTSVRQNFMGERKAFLNEGTIIGSYQSWDFNAQITLWEYINAYVDIKNMFDEKYTIRQYYKSGGRVIWTGLKASF